MMAKQAGFQPLILTDRVQGEAREIAKVIAGMIRSTSEFGFPLKTPACLIFGGEPTVTIQGDGLGGRNQEIVLAVLAELQDFSRPFYFSSVGTDGTDGPTDAAGAWIMDTTMKKVNNKKLKITEYLNRNDAYHFFETVDQLIKTGPTRTNVMDLMFCLIC
jgi:glycerate-2-kinase